MIEEYYKDLMNINNIWIVKKRKRGRDMGREKLERLV